MQRRLTLLASLTALAAIVLPGQAAALERSFDPTPGVVTPPPPGAAVEHDLYLGPAPSMRAGALAAKPGKPYRTEDGKTVWVDVSKSYAEDPAADRRLVDFLGSLLHRGELHGLYVYVAAPEELRSICGPQAAACYDSNRERIYMVGASSYGGLPTDYVLAHEYGHHVANNRANSGLPGGALHWGTKRWATYHGACPGVVSGRFSLDPRRHYYRFPGEAFAEAFAYYHFPGGRHPERRIGWAWHKGFRPTSRSYDLLAADVRRPLKGARVARRSGRLRQKGDRADAFSFKTPLDGGMIVKLTGPRGDDFDLRVYETRFGRSGASRGRGSRERLKFLVCGAERVNVVVRAHEGGGRYRLVARIP